MSFAQSLERLRAGLATPSGGMSQDYCRVRRTDLRQLLEHFDRLDEEVRRAAEEREPYRGSAF